MSAARNLAGLGNQNTLAVETGATEVGIASTAPSSTLDVRGEVKVGTNIQLGSAGVITATSYTGSFPIVDASSLAVSGISTLVRLAVTDEVVTGIITALGLSGNLTGAAATITGALNVDATTDSTSTTTGALIVDGGVGIAKNVYIGAGLSVAGTLTYEDVTNVDSVGLITAKSGVNVSGGQLAVGVAYSVGAAGVATAAGFVGGTISGTTGTFTGDVDIADKIVHTGDTNTALRFPTADTISAETGGSERLRINSDGDVLIATTSTPSADIKLLVSGNGGVSSGSYFSFRGDYGNVSEPAAHAIKFDSTISASGGLHLYSYGGTQFDLGGQPRVNFTQAGSVGVGTTNPQNSAKVQNYTSTTRHQSFQSTDGDFAIVTDNNSSPAAYIKGTGSADLLNVFDNTTEVFTILDGGNVGIKSEIPGHPLDVFGNIRSHQSTPSLYLQTTATASDSAVIRFGDAASFQNGSIQYDFSGNQHLRFKMGGSGNNVERMVLEGSTGYVGINTTTPTTYLDVFGGSNSIEVGNQSGSGRFGADGTSTKIGSHTNHHFDIFTNSSSNRKLRITSGGGFLFDNGELVERCNITAGKLSDNTNIDLEDGMVHYFTTQESTTSTPNIRVNSSTTLNSVMGAGDVVSVTLVTTAAAGGYSANVTIDGNAVTEEWVGGSAPSAGGSDGVDIYSYTIICTHNTNTGDSGFKVIANLTNAT